MAPTAQEHKFSTMEKPPSECLGERVVISGMAGLYPDSHSVKELSEILYNKENPISSKNLRWTYNHPEVAQFTGNVPELELFDAQFFKVHYRLSNSMDSMGRKVLEQAYQAIYDAGVSPEQLSGKKVGVYIGSCFSETEKACFYVASSRTGFGIAGCSKTMFANRISYWLNAKGPSMAVDEACCSSTEALELAYLAITRGDCEAAIVGGCNLCLHPQSSIHYGRIMTLSMDGKTKSFDNNASGCARSEAINVLFLQKAKNALRVYAEVISIKCEFTGLLQRESGPRYGFYRDPANISAFIKKFYAHAKVSPQDVEYVEALGSAVPEVDKAELDALSEVFCKNRTKPLLVGSVMSNIGYGEAASGISAVTKVLLGYHTGQLAANLDCESPRKDVVTLSDGRMRIVTEHQPFGRTYAAVNGLSVTGVNTHVLLHGRYKPKDPSRYKSNIPHLVLISARQESAVKNILDDLKSRPIDPEELALFHNIHQTKISGHLGRGFTILDTDDKNETVSLCEKVDYFDPVKRPVWFVYSGMGSQWAGMGSQLMRIPIFAAAIQRCHRVLHPKGIDIVHIITSPDKTIFDNILNSFVGIAAIQIGLTDILTELGLVPDKIIGHSVGELGCAYADGCFTAEEMILAAYSRGLVSVETPFIRGSMAAVGIGYQQVSKLCPPEIEVACHNGPESSTISGPANVMREFVAQLSEKDIFAKEVPCSNIAYHSRYIAEAGPGLLMYLKEVIKSPKPRSDRWVSTSVPMDKWDEPAAKYSSAEYHTNNLLNPVLFEETSTLIPADAVLIEIAPHGLLQAILKRSLPDSCRHVPLTRRGHADNARFLLEAVGTLYMEGFNPKIDALYPKIEFPVSTGTPFLSHLVQWAHNELWNLPLYVSAHRKTAAACKFVICIHDEEHSYLKGHIIKEKNVFPFAAALVAAWDTLAMTLGAARKQLAVHFHDVYLHAEPTIHDRRQLRLHVALHRGTGRFEILVNKTKIISGFMMGNLPEKKVLFDSKCETSGPLNLNSNDVYELFYKKDYRYKGDFRSILSSNTSVTEAHLRWQNNWVTLIDGMIQMNILKHNHDTVSKPNFIQNIYIDINQHGNTEILQIKNESVMTACISEEENSTRCGGVIIENMTFRNHPLYDMNDIPLKTLKIVPHFDTNNTDTATAIKAFVKTVAVNLNKDELNVLEISNNDYDRSKYGEIKTILSDLKEYKCQYSSVTKESVLKSRDNFLLNVDLLLVTNLSNDDKACQMLYRILARDVFLVNKEDYVKDFNIERPSALYRTVCARRVAETQLELVRWRPTSIAAVTSVFTVRSHLDLDLLTSTQATLRPNQKLLVISSYPPVAGLKDLIKKWRKDFDRHINLVMVNHTVTEKQELDRLPNIDLAFNVLDHGIWGGEYFVPIEGRPNVSGEVMLQSCRFGDLDSLHWIETQSKETGISVKVHYAGINHMDVERATGIISFDEFEMKVNRSYYGMDFSGITDSGCRVMGLLSKEALKTRLTARPELLWPVPAHWTLEDAATVPLAYCMAFYCLSIKGQLLPKMRVLVHGGAGALGQAAISIALGNGCPVFTTVSDVRKKRFLQKLFPQLKDAHIGNSRDNTYGDMILNETNGRGCDIVICCLKGELKITSLKSNSSFGVVYDTTHKQSKEDYNFGMNYLTYNRAYSSVHFSSIFNEENTKDIKRLQLLVSEGIARGYVRPLSRVTYEPHHVSRAFRLIAASNHRGRVLINMQNTSFTNVIRRLNCSSNGCHAVITDDESLGLMLADRLINRGARKLHLHMLKLSDSLQFKLLYKYQQSWQKLGVQVEVSCDALHNLNKATLFLNNITRLGNVEGIYMAFTDQHATEQMNTIVKNIDEISRKMCSLIRYFGVISTGQFIGDKICCLRRKDRLPATMIQLPKLKKFDDQDETNQTQISVRDAINAIESSLCSGEAVIIASPKKVLTQTMLQQIAVISDISIPGDLPHNITLEELGLDVSKAPAVSTFIRDIYDVNIPEEQVLTLTKQKIEEFQQIENTEYQEVKGLATFFSFVDSDELLATTEMVFVPTLVNSSSMRDDEFDVNQTSLCVVPGMEGHHARFKTLCERLKLPALVLQPGLERPNETLPKMAERFAEILLKKANLNKDFYLLGYESGVIIALEMASILEKHGLTGTIFCVGGSPDDFKSELELQLAEHKSEEELQIAVLHHMYSLMTGENANKLDNILQRSGSWREKVKSCVRALLGRVAHSAQYAGDLIETAYARIVQARRYTPTLTPLRSRLVLLRAASCSSDPHSLQRFSQQPLLVHNLRAPLSYAAEDLRCSAIVNSYLSRDILDAYENLNLCETYLLNADSFMTSSKELSQNN